VASAKINISYSILFNLTTSYSSYFGGKKGISSNKTSFFLLMCAAPVLIQPNFNKKFFLQVDASAYGMGTVLLQEGNFTTPSLEKQTKPTLHPIAYYSATFTPTE